MCDGVRVLDTVSDAVFDIDGDCVCVGVMVGVAVVGGVAEGDPVYDGVDVTDGVAAGVVEVDAPLEWDADCVAAAVADTDIDGVEEVDPVKVGVTEDVWDCVGDHVTSGVSAGHASAIGATATPRNPCVAAATPITYFAAVLATYRYRRDTDVAYRTKLPAVPSNRPVTDMIA